MPAQGCQRSGEADRRESAVAEAEVESKPPLLVSPLRVSTHPVNYFDPPPRLQHCSSASGAWRRWEHSQPRSPAARLDAHALRGDSALIDPTCHAEAMANFSTACISNSGDGQLTSCNNSGWKKVVWLQKTMFQRHFILEGWGGRSHRAMRGKTNKPLSVLQTYTRKHKTDIRLHWAEKGKTATWGVDSLWWSRAPSRRFGPRASVLSDCDVTQSEKQSALIRLLTPHSSGKL